MVVFKYTGILVKNKKEKIKQINKKKRIKNKKIILLVFFIISLVVSVFLAGYNETLSVMQDKYGNYSIYLIVNILMITNIMIISKFTDYIMDKQKIISYIGQNTLFILLFHKFPILFFQRICPYIKDILNQEDTIINNLIGILVSLIVIGLCIGFKYLIDLIVLRSRKHDTN